MLFAEEPPGEGCTEQIGGNRDRRADDQTELGRKPECGQQHTKNRTEGIRRIQAANGITVTPRAPGIRVRHDGRQRGAHGHRGGQQQQQRTRKGQNSLTQGRRLRTDPFEQMCV
jgi:hypothetical protein